MKLCVFGASSRIGSALVRQALGRGHAVTVFYRSDSRSSPLHDVKVVWGDLFCRSDLDRAVQGADAVVCLYRRRPPRYHTLFSQVTAAIIEAMKAHGVKRLLYVADAAIGGGSFKPGLFITAMHWWYEMRYPSVARDRARQEELVVKSGLEWTIIKTPRLTGGPKTGRYRVGTDLKVNAFSKVSREDLGMVILDQLDSVGFVGKRVVVKYRILGFSLLQSLLSNMSC
jgi:putative NADH-flavin reductase